MVITQPRTGTVATLALSLLSIGICALFTPEQFGSWVTLILVSMVPSQIILTLFLGGELPGSSNDIKQPFKGSLLMLLTLVTGGITYCVIQFLNEGLLNLPTPFSIMQAILTVVVALWMVIVFQGWPASLIRNPFISAFVLLLSVLLVSYCVFQLLFNFSVFQAAPFYSSSLDPVGLLSAWHALALATTSVAVILVFVMLDFWPFSVFKTSPLINAAAIALLSSAVWAIAVYVVKADPVRYMVAGPISMIFGEFILLIMLQTAPFQQMPQPKKGSLLTLIALALCLSLFPIYESVAVGLFPELVAGAPAYGVELWIASAMLAVTFPIFVLYAEMFQFWPFQQNINKAVIHESAES